MVKKTAPLVVVLVAAGVAGTIAQAKPSHAKKSHLINERGTLAAIATTGRPPAPGSRETAAGQLEGSGFRILTHSRVPPNDGGISLGQAVVAAARDRAGLLP